MTAVKKNGKDLNGNGRLLIEVLSQYLVGYTEEKKEDDNLSQNGRCPGQDSNRKCPEYKTRRLPPRQPAR
jgi:hypothetical protein